MRALLQRTITRAVAHACRLLEALVSCASTTVATTTLQHGAPHSTAPNQHRAAPKKEKPPIVPQRKGLRRRKHQDNRDAQPETLPALNDLVGLAGFGLITVQWLMDDVLVLRSFGLASCASMVIFNLCRKPPVMLPVYFNVLFIAVNGYFIARIVDERRDVELCGDAALLWESALSDSGLPRKAVQALVEAGDVVVVATGRDPLRGKARHGGIERPSFFRGSSPWTPRANTSRKYRWATSSASSATSTHDLRAGLDEETGRRRPPRACEHVLWWSHAVSPHLVGVRRLGRPRGVAAGDAARRRGALREEAHREARAHERPSRARPAGVARPGPHLPLAAVAPRVSVHK